MKLKVSEHQLMTLLKNYLTAKGWYVMRLNAGMIKTETGHRVRLAEVGMPDLMAFRRYGDLGVKVKSLIDDASVLVFIEVKVPGDKPTFAQEHKMEELREHGARTIVAHSLEELEEYLKGGE